MSPLNIEIKARTAEQDKIRALLRERAARFVGEDHQIDTYYRVPRGRLKLRQGTIERNLIYYERPDQQGPKASNVMLYKPGPDAALKEILTQVLGVLVVVDKRREIYFIDNVKFHLDRVDHLGAFVEIEAIDTDGRQQFDAQGGGDWDTFYSRTVVPKKVGALVEQGRLPEAEAFRQWAENDEIRRGGRLFASGLIKGQAGDMKGALGDFIAAGKIKPLWIQGQRRFHPDNVMAYLRTCEKQPRSHKRRRGQG